MLSSNKLNIDNTVTFSCKSAITATEFTIEDQYSSKCL